MTRFAPLKPPGRERRDRFLLGQKPWVMIPGMIVIFILTTVFLFQLIREEAGPAILFGSQVLSAGAVWWLSLGFIVLFGSIGMMLGLRLITGNDGKQWVDLDLGRIHAAGMGILRREVIVPYDAVRRVVINSNRGFVGIEIRHDGGKLELAELLFEDKRKFQAFHASLLAALGGVDNRGVPLFNAN